MPRAIITFTDLHDGGCDLDVNFGPGVDENSQAHQMAVLCIKFMERNFPVEMGKWSYEQSQETKQ